MIRIARVRGFRLTDRKTEVDRMPLHCIVWFRARPGINITFRRGIGARGKARRRRQTSWFPRRRNAATGAEGRRNVTFISGQTLSLPNGFGISGGAKRRSLHAVVRRHRSTWRTRRVSLAQRRRRWAKPRYRHRQRNVRSSRSP